MDTAGEEGENKDWINELPDCILSSIVSSLNLKDAMDAVPMVCRRWRRLDPMLNRVNLEFDIPNNYGVMDERLLEDDDEMEFADLLQDFPRQDFVRRVNKVLELYQYRKIDSFKVAFFLDRESTTILDEWIRFAITKGVSVLDLHLYFCAEFRTVHDDYVFPCELLSELNASSSLRNLTLTRCVLRPPAGFSGFSQLTSLYLYDVILDCENSFIERLLFEYCLFLESLTIKECRGMGTDFILHGPSLRLKELKLVECYHIERVEVSLPNLACIEVVYACTGNNFQISGKHLARMSALLEGGNGELCRALTQIASFPVLQTLHLVLTEELEIPQSIPTFRHLKTLEVDIILRHEESDLLTVVSILKATPLLEELVLSLRSDTFFLEAPVFCGFTHDCLRKVKLQGFQSMACEIEFAVCLLKSTTKLEIMLINPFGKKYVGAGVWSEVPSLARKHQSNAHWEERGRATVQERLKEVKTDAQVVIM